MPKANPIHTPIPLNCTICAKKPQFSDVSHLLTHVSSKAHLAVKHNLGIKSQTDQDAGQQLQDYQAWYNIYNIAGLLAERMAAKENKANGVKNKKIKIEEGEDDDNIHPGLQNLAAGQAYRAPVPRMQPPMPRNVTQLRARPNPRPSGPAPGWADDSLYGTPTMRSPLPNFTPDNNDSESYEEEVEEEDPSSIELKGIIWPGMAGFDAATPEQQRQRNQKKDGSILRQLEYTSEYTPAVEVVYNFHFQEVKRRGIDTLGEDADEDSLEPRPSPPPAKRRGRGAAKTGNALKKVDVNVPRKPQPPRKTKGRMGLRQTSFPNEEPRPEPFPFGSAFPDSRSASTRTTPSIQLEPDNEGGNDYFGKLGSNGVKNMMLRRNVEHNGFEAVETKVVLTRQSWGRDERNSTDTESPLEEHRFEELNEHQPKIESESPPSYSHYQANNLGPLLYAENPSEHAQTGLSAAPRFVQGYGYQQYHQESHTLNPLNAHLMNAFLPQLRDRDRDRDRDHYQYPGNRDLEGDYKPFIDGGGDNPGAESFSNPNENAPFHN